jgi:plasmid maintenance system killer protein
MKIQFADKKLEKECNEERLLQRRHGANRANLLKRRLAVLDAAATLSELGPPYRGPMRCHELTTNRAGQLSIDLDHPYRLIFIPDHEPRPMRPQGGLDWNQVTAIRIIEIVDTHE